MQTDTGVVAPPPADPAVAGELRSGATPEILEFFRVRGFVYPDACQAIYRVVDSQIVGGWLFTGYTGQSIQIHFCGKPGWLTRRLYELPFIYAFDQLGVKVIIATVALHNLRASKIGAKLGFKKVGVISELELELITLNRNACRVLNRPRRGTDG